MIARWLVSIFGTLIACLGAWVVFDPRGLIAFGELFLTPGGLWFAVVLLYGLWRSAARPDPDAIRPSGPTGL